MDYYTIIRNIYPVTTDDDFELMDNSDGAGVFIARWNTAKLGPKPALAELATHWPAVQAAIKITSIREQRNKLLTESDWTQTGDSPLASAQKQAWATYRQALRDAPTIGIIPSPPAP